MLRSLTAFAATRDLKNRPIFTDLKLQACKTFINLATGSIFQATKSIFLTKAAFCCLQPQLTKHRSIHSAPVQPDRKRGPGFGSGSLSSYHEKCFENWVPAPAKTTPKVRKIRSHRPENQFPLCLVCDRDESDDADESFECLVEKFDRSVKRLVDSWYWVSVPERVFM